MYCTKCGSEIREDAKFCEKCGSPVNSNTSVHSETKKPMNLLVIVAAVIAALVVVLVIVIVVANIYTGKKATKTTEVISGVENDLAGEDVVEPIKNQDMDTEDVFRADGENRDMLLQQKLEELGPVFLDGMSYNHTLVQTEYGELYQSEGLAQTKGVFASEMLDLNQDGEKELYTFSLEYEANDDYAFHNVYVTAYDVENGVVVEKGKELIDTAFGSSYDKGDIRVMLKDSQYLCIDASSLCCLEGDGAFVGMVILSYDGNALNTVARTGYNGSDWYEAGKGQQAFTEPAMSVGLARTCYLMSQQDHFYFSPSDGLEALFKMHAEMEGEYSAKVITTTISLIKEDPANDYILKDSSSRVLDKAEASSLSKDQLRLARNEIYARYGWDFEDEGLKSYFNSKAWYRPSFDVGNISDSDLSDVETANRDLIVGLEK